MSNLTRSEIQSIRARARRLIELKAAQRELECKIKRQQATLKGLLGSGGIVTLPSEGQEIVVDHRDEVAVPAHVRPAHDRVVVRKRSTEESVVIGENGLTA